MNARIEYLKNQLDSLKEFLKKDSFTAAEIADWISSCVAFFSSIRVNESIISEFMNTFRYQEPGTDNVPTLIGTDIGPFSKASGKAKYHLQENIFDPINLHQKMLYIKIAFRTAKNIIEGLEDAERIVPKPISEFFKEKNDYKHICSSLELMESNYQSRDADALLNNTITLLESILSLEPSLAGKRLSSQINLLQGDKELRVKFGCVRQELLSAFHNFRIQRNQLCSHKGVPIEYDIPFSIALSAAYLVIMFLNITMSTGALIE